MIAAAVIVASHYFTITALTAKIAVVAAVMVQFVVVAIVM